MQQVKLGCVSKYDPYKLLSNIRDVMKTYSFKGDVIKMFKTDLNKKKMDDEIIEKVRKSKEPVAIWGGGEVGRFVQKKLVDGGVESIVIVQNNSSQDKEMYVDELNKTYSSYFLFAGHLEAYTYKEDSFSIFTNKVGTFFLSDIHSSDGGSTERIDKKWYCNHQMEFEYVYSNLKDKKSREHMDAYLRAKVDEDGRQIRSLFETPQYFSGKFLMIGDDESFVDCGAYVGDTISEFINITQEKYSKIIALEPDGLNVKRLREFCKNRHLKNVDIYESGAYSRCGTLNFDSNGILSQINATGRDIIHVNTIDNIVKDGKCSIIKMDIEGSEMNALYGAKNAICRNHPTLMISAYHKKDDLYEIMTYIKSCWDGYNFYFRCHKPLPIDAVLYAVP